MAHPEITQNSLPDRHPDPLIDETLQRVHHNGWSVVAVGEVCDCGSPDCEPPDTEFAYTVGAPLHGIAELAVYGLDHWTSYLVLAEVLDQLHTYQWDKIVDASATLNSGVLDLPIRLISMIDSADLLVSNALFPGAPAVQVVWPDPCGVFPWEDHYQLSSADQPLLGVPASPIQAARECAATGGPAIARPPRPPRRKRRKAAQSRKRRRSPRARRR